MSAYVGQQLRSARREKDLTLDQVAQETFIRRRYLEAMESGDLSIMPSVAQSRGFLRAYADFLGLDGEALVIALEDPVAELIPDQEEAEPVSVPVNSLEEFDTLFVEIGKLLKDRRELLGLSLSNIENQTHVRLHYLQALEEGAIEKLPSQVQGRGMLQNYASFLGLDPDPLLLKYADGIQRAHTLRRGEHPLPNLESNVTPPSFFRRLLSGDLLFGTAVIAALFIFVVWGMGQVFGLQAEQDNQPPSATAPSIAEVLIPSGTPSPSPTITATPSETPTPDLIIDPGVDEGENGSTGDEGDSGDETADEAPTETPVVLLPPTNEEAIQLYIVIRQRAWMRVTVDGEVDFEGRVIPGSAYPFSGRDSIEVLTGNGAALQVFFNQNDVGPLGIFGEVVRQVYTPAGILLPTPTITPTPSITPEPSETPTPEGL